VILAHERFDERACLALVLECGALLSRQALFPAQLSLLFTNFYRSRFPSLWGKFDALVDNGQILSVREVLREINAGGPERACGSGQRLTRKSALCQQRQKLLAFRAVSQSSTSSKILSGGNSYRAAIMPTRRTLLAQILLPLHLPLTLPGYISPCKPGSSVTS
jgi:hypothetical protein